MNLLTNRINGRKHFSLLVSMSLSVMVFFLVMVVSNAALAAKLVVKEGSRGDNVVKVQLRLIEKGFLQNLSHFLLHLVDLCQIDVGTIT